MSADAFFHEAKGPDPQTAFDEACEEARYWYGHAGYTGTIAEKEDYLLIDHPREGMTDKEIREYAEQLISDSDPRIDDKWGPAGCLKLSEGFLFFGWASS